MLTALHSLAKSAAICLSPVVSCVEEAVDVVVQAQEPQVRCEVLCLALRLLPSALKGNIHRRGALKWLAESGEAPIAVLIASDLRKLKDNFKCWACMECPVHLFPPINTPISTEFYAFVLEADTAL